MQSKWKIVPISWNINMFTLNIRTFVPYQIASIVPYSYVWRGSFCCILSVRIWGHLRGWNCLNWAVSEIENYHYNFVFICCTLNTHFELYSKIGINNWQIKSIFGLLRTWIVSFVICNLQPDKKSSCQTLFTSLYLPTQIPWKYMIWVYYEPWLHERLRRNWLQPWQCASHNQGRKNNGKQSLCGFAPSRTFKYIPTQLSLCCCAYVLS